MINYVTNGRMGLFWALQHSFTIVFSLLLCVRGAHAQLPTDGATPLAIAPGSPAGSYSLSGFEDVNLYNGSLNIQLPLLKVGGRGGAQYVMTHVPIPYRWLIEHQEWGLGEHVNIPVHSWWGGLLPDYGPGVLQGRGAMEPCQEGSSQTYTVTRLTFTTADGTEYELRDQRYQGQPLVSACVYGALGPDRGQVFISADGTSATFISNTPIYDSLTPTYYLTPSGYLTLRDGTRYKIDEGQVTEMRDRNGNKLTFFRTTWPAPRQLIITDSLNRQIIVNYSVNDVAPYGLCDQIIFKGADGAQRIIRVSRTQMSAVLRPNSGYTIKQYNELFPEAFGGGTAGEFNEWVTSAVWLPDDGINRRAYKFYYNSYGEVARIELPTGGAIEYEYGPGIGNSYQNGLIDLHWLDGYLKQAIYRRVTERRVYPDGGAGNNFEIKTTYGIGEDDCGGPINDSDFTVAHFGRPAEGFPDGVPLGSELHAFYGKSCKSFFKDATSYPVWREGREYQTVGSLGTRVGAPTFCGLLTGVELWHSSIPLNHNRG